jgi:hypothetical protein
MKLTPFVLFCILLLVLVISSIFGNSLIQGFKNVEGFQEGAGGLTSMSLSQYSTQRNVFELYDNIYYDDVNANLIEITTTIPVTKGNSKNTLSQSSTIVTPRDGKNSVTYINQFKTTPEPTDVPTSQLSNISNSYVYWVYPSQSSDKNYSVFYMPWGLDTYIHIIDGKTSTNIGTYALLNGGAINNYSFPTNSQVGLTGYYADSDSANMSMVYEPTYTTSRKVYQLSHFVKYDTLNGNLLIQSGDGATKTINVYDINNTSTILTAANQQAISSNKTALTPKTNFQPFTVLDVNGQNLVLYVPTQKKVLVALISYSDSTKTKYTVKVCRFTENGLDTGSIVHHDIQQQFDSGSGNPLSDYYKMYMFMNSMGMPNQGQGFSEDYILKTQIVPPVCPTCPACPATPGTCTNCGGQGGSGTLANKNTSLLPDGSTSNGNVSNIGSGTFSSNANPDTIGGSLTLATYDTVAGVEDVAKSGAGAITGVANSGVNAITGVANSGVNAITGVANTIGGIGNNAINSVENVLTSNPTQISSGGSYENNYLKPNQRSIVGPGTQNQYNSANDPYSYYGKLPPRGRADFMPLNSDFSRFGR